MAVDGKKFSGTLSLGSEDWYEFPCSSCFKDCKNVAAAKYCVDCGENLCSICLSQHNMFAVMKVHQITDKLYSLPTQRCDRHGGKLVDVYCPSHDTVGCSTCISVGHRTCKHIKFIHDVARDLKPTKDITDVESRLEYLLARLDQLKQQKEDHLQSLMEEKKKLLKDIKDLRKKIDNQLDKMEKTLVDVVDAKLGTKTSLVSDDIDIIVKTVSLLETRQKSLENAKAINSSELFVQLKTAYRNIQEQEENLKHIGYKSDSINMTLLPNAFIQTLVENDISLGQITEILIPTSAVPDRDVSVRLKSEGGPYIITDICLLSDGNILIADCMNKRIKKLDQSFSITEHLDLPGNPSRLCEVDDLQIAVTLLNLKKVQFVSKTPLKLGKSFPVGDICRGMDCHNGQLYVCCGGEIDRGQGPGHIEVYSVGGELLRSYFDGTDLPTYIKVSDRGNLLISNAKSSSLTVICTHDNSVKDVQIAAVLQPLGICKLGDSQMIIAGNQSNNIMLISEDGEQQQQLLIKADGILEPRAVCFDRKQSKLMVSLSNSDIVKVFKISSDLGSLV